MVGFGKKIARIDENHGNFWSVVVDQVQTDRSLQTKGSRRHNARPKDIVQMLEALRSLHGGELGGQVWSGGGHWFTGR